MQKPVRLWGAGMVTYSSMFHGVPHPRQQCAVHKNSQRCHRQRRSLVTGSTNRHALSIVNSSTNGCRSCRTGTRLHHNLHLMENWHTVWPLLACNVASAAACWKEKGAGHSSTCNTCTPHVCTTQHGFRVQRAAATLLVRQLTRLHCMHTFEVIAVHCNRL